MNPIPFLRARLSERSSRIQLVVLALMGAVMTGFVSMEQIQGWSAQAVAMVALLGPLAGILFPDPAKGVDPAAAAAAAEALARAAAERAVGSEAAAQARTAAENLSKALADAGVDTDELMKKLGV